MYFEYKEHGHMKAQCPKLRRKWHSRGKKNKILIATWDDTKSDESNSSDEKNKQSNFNLYKPS